MNSDLYRDVRLVLGDADESVAKMLSAALFPLGLRDISTSVDADQLLRAVATTVDIVLCDTQLSRLDFRQFAQDVRQGRIGGNPFVVLIATAHHVEPLEVARILESGVDDLIIKPLNSEIVVQRIGAMINKRKPFVVTTEYVGPSRRAKRREDGTDDKVVVVPNTLRAKVAQRHQESDIARLVESERSNSERHEGEERARHHRPDDAAAASPEDRRGVDRQIAPRSSHTGPQGQRGGDRIPEIVGVEPRCSDCRQHFAPIVPRRDRARQAA